MYSEKVLDHFQNPRNLGRIQEPDGEGSVGSGECGDYLVMTIKVDALDGLPDEKLHCSVMGAGALKKAIYDYLGKKHIAES